MLRALTLTLKRQKIIIMCNPLAIHRRQLPYLTRIANINEQATTSTVNSTNALHAIVILGDDHLLAVYCILLSVNGDCS